MGARPSAQQFSNSWGIRDMPRIPFLETLNLPNLTKLMNDPVAHLPQWPPITTKLPSNIPNFEGNPREDPSNHIMTFHLVLL